MLRREKCEREKGHMWEAMKVGEDFFGKERETQLGIWNLKVAAFLFIILIFFCLERSRKRTNWGKRKKQVKEKIGENAGMQKIERRDWQKSVATTKVDALKCFIYCNKVLDVI
jgi:hypothetical protein